MDNQQTVWLLIVLLVMAGVALAVMAAQYTWLRIRLALTDRALDEMRAARGDMISLSTHVSADTVWPKSSLMQEMDKMADRVRTTGSPYPTKPRFRRPKP